jgi:hypothetical protein
MDRVQRQSEIAEAAANENKDQNEVKLRENFMVQKLWSQFYKMKMNKEMKRSFTVEDAFQRIRSTTAITDVQEIVHKYLTREQIYAHLLQAVGEHERKLEGLRKQTEVKRELIGKLQIEHNELVRNSGVPAATSSTNASGKSKGGDTVDTELVKLSEEIECLERELETVGDRGKKIDLVRDQVGGWANRVVSKLQSQLLGDGAPLRSGAKHSLTSLFDQITETVSDALETAAQDAHDVHLGEDMSLAIAKDFLKDVENEEFFAKNFRVRPASGVTGGGNEERQSEHISRNNLAMAEPTDDEDKFNKMMNIEMEEQRKKIKLQKDDAIRKKALEAEKKEKALQKKNK